MYIEEKKFSYIKKRGYERPIFLKWLMEKQITVDTPIKKLKYPNYLPHQLEIDEEVIDDFKLGIQYGTKLMGYNHKGTLIGASPYW